MKEGAVMGHLLQRFPSIRDHSVIPYGRKNAVDSLLAHVLVGEPGSTSPEHALACPGGEIMRYFNVLGHNDRARGGSEGWFFRFCGSRAAENSARKKPIQQKWIAVLRENALPGKVSAHCRFANPIPRRSATIQATGETFHAP
jgi:hypothetical protein